MMVGASFRKPRSPSEQYVYSQAKLKHMSHLRTGEKRCANSSSLHSGHQASIFHSRMPTMATLMLPKVIRQPAIIGEAMRHVRSILRMPAYASPVDTREEDAHYVETISRLSILMNEAMGQVRSIFHMPA